jgi:hypothetical protein
MAFLPIEPVDVEGCPSPPSSAVLVRVPLRLPEPAAVEMIAPQSFGAMIAANAMAIEADRPVTPEQAQDALAEFLNILASALMPPITAIASAEEIVKGVPEIETSAEKIDWNGFIADERTVLFSAEGCVVACRLTVES